MTETNLGKPTTEDLGKFAAAGDQLQQLVTRALGTDASQTGEQLSISPDQLVIPGNLTETDTALIEKFEKKVVKDLQEKGYASWRLDDPVKIAATMKMGPFAAIRLVDYDPRTRRIGIGAHGAITANTDIGRRRLQFFRLAAGGMATPGFEANAEPDMLDRTVLIGGPIAALTVVPDNATAAMTPNLQDMLVTMGGAMTGSRLANLYDRTSQTQGARAASHLSHQLEGSRKGYSIEQIGGTKNDVIPTRHEFIGVFLGLDAEIPYVVTLARSDVDGDALVAGRLVHRRYNDKNVARAYEGVALSSLTTSGNIDTLQRNLAASR